MAQLHPLILFLEGPNVTDGMDQDAQETSNAPHCQNKLRLRVRQLRPEMLLHFALHLLQLHRRLPNIATPKPP